MKEEYEYAVDIIIRANIRVCENKILMCGVNPKSIEKLKEAGVLHWFEPVYRELPKINGYDGKMDGDYIVYGSNCAKFHKDFFTDLVHLKPQGQNRAIKSITLDSGVTITMEQINKIVDYINSKK